MVPHDCRMPPFSRAPPRRHTFWLCLHSDFANRAPLTDAPGPSWPAGVNSSHQPSPISMMTTTASPPFPCKTPPLNHGFPIQTWPQKVVSRSTTIPDTASVRRASTPNLGHRITNDVQEDALIFDSSEADSRAMLAERQAITGHYTTNSRGLPTPGANLAMVFRSHPRERCRFSHHYASIRAAARPYSFVPDFRRSAPAMAPRPNDNCSC